MVSSIVKSASDSGGHIRLDAYLATALTGLSEADRIRVFGISDAISNACRQAEIELYEPRKSTDPVHHPNVSDYDVFQLDREKVSTSNLLLYVADFPSTGAGQELIIASNSLVPVVAVANASFRVSRMVTGMPGDFTLLRYESVDELESTLATTLRNMRPNLERRKEVAAAYQGNQIGMEMERIRKSRGMTYEDVAAAFRVPKSVTARQIEQCEKSSDLQNNLSVLFLRELAIALNVETASLLR
jgi:hypothetical protein